MILVALQCEQLTVRTSGLLANGPLDIPIIIKIDSTFILRIEWNKILNKKNYIRFLL